MHKPLGIALAAMFCTFWGLLLLPVGYVTSVASGVRGAPHHAGLYGFVCMAFGLSMLASAYGLWRLQTWGRTLAIRIVVATLPLSVLAFVGSLLGKASVGAAMSCLVGIGLAALVIRYLGCDETRQMFEG